MEKLEINRKIVHFLFGVLLAGLAFYGILDKYVFLFWGAALIVLLVLSQRFKWVMNNFERPENRKRFPGKGAVMFIIAAELCLIFFPKDVFIASMLILAIGDSIPNLISGRIKHPFSKKRYLEASLVGWVISFLACINFVTWYEAMVSSAAAIFLEAVELKIGKWKIDDNLVMPIAAGAIITAIRLL